MRKVVVAVMMWVATAIPAQQSKDGQQAKYGESVSVTIVEVPVTVVDRAGKPVRGLTTDQFEVTVDGKKVAISAFDVVDLATIADEPSSTPLPSVAYRNFLLLFDLSQSTPGTIGRAQAAAKELVTEGLTRRDVAAVATYSVENGLNVVTSFTSDKALLLAAIETLGVPEYFKAADPLRIAVRPRVPDVFLPTLKERGETRLHVLTEFRHNEAADRNRGLQATDEEGQRASVRRQLQQFGSVARMLDGLAGQKQVVLLSEGFDSSIIEGRKNATEEEKNNVTRQTWTATSEQHFGSSREASEINDMAELFRRSDVTLHAIDIKGLRSDVDASAGVKRVSNDALYFLTRPTGGTVFANATRLSESFAQLLAQQEVVYVLAFSSPRTFEQNRFHPIKVKVRATGDPRVSHRAGFYEKSALPDTPAQETLTLADILMKDRDVKDVALSLFAVALPSTDSDARVPIVIELPGEKLVAEARDGAVSAEFFVYAFDEQNQVRDFLQQRLGLDLARHGEKLRGGGLRYVSSLRLPPGRHVIKALVRIDETGRLGLTRVTVTVPAASNAVFFGEPSTWINVAAPDRGADAVAAFTADGRKFSPSTHPSLRSGGAVNLAVFVDENANRELRAEVIGADGSAEAVSLPVVASDAIKLLLEFKPPAVAAGEYRLRITVGGAHVDLPFRVE